MTLKIGFVCSEYFSYKEKNGKLVPTSAHGGFGFLTRTKAEFLAALGHEVHVFTYSSSFDYDRRTADVVEEKGLRFTR